MTYQPAKIDAGEQSLLWQMERELSKITGQNIVLVAYAPRPGK